MLVDLYGRKSRGRHTLSETPVRRLEWFRQGLSNLRNLIVNTHTDEDGSLPSVAFEYLIGCDAGSGGKWVDYFRAILDWSSDSGIPVHIYDPDSKYFRDSPDLKIGGGVAKVLHDPRPDEITENDKPLLFWRLSDPNAYLSNWYPSTIFMDGIRFSSAEQALMHSKANITSSESTMDKILKTDNPLEIKQLGRHQVRPSEVHEIGSGHAGFCHT